MAESSKSKKLNHSQSATTANGKKRVVQTVVMSHSKAPPGSGHTQPPSNQFAKIASSLQTSTDKSSSLQAALDAAPRPGEVAKDFTKGTAKYAASKAHRFAHNKIAEAEQDNAGIAAFHKVEDGAEKLIKQGGKTTVNAAKSIISEHNLKKGDIAKLKQLYGENLTTKELVAKANIDFYSGANPLKAPTPFKSNRLQFASAKQVSGLALGSSAVVKEGATAIGKAAISGKNALKFGTSSLSCSLQSKYQQAIGDDPALRSMSAAGDVASVPTKYAMKKGGKVLHAAASKSAPARAWVAVRQKARNFLAKQQMKFLSKHKNVAAARGVMMKAKAIVQKLIKELILKSKPVIVAFAVILVGALIFEMAIAPLIAMFKSGSEAIIMSTYPTDNATITDSSGQWRDMEVTLLNRIDNIESEYSGFDEYTYDVDTMTHDPFQLMSYLSAMNVDYTHADVSAQIAALFGQQNNLELIEHTETRTDSDGNEYEYKTLTVKLKPKPFETVVMPILEASDAKEMYDLYLESGGGRQIFGTPILDDWRGRVTYPFNALGSPTGVGYSVHEGLDLGYPIGTPILSVHTGVVVVSEYHSLYGNYIVIRDALGKTSLYAHCSARHVSVGDIVQKGQEIAAVGQTGNVTGPHLHIEIKVGGVKVNPIFYISYPGIE